MNYIPLNKKTLLCSIGVWCFMLGQSELSELPVRSGGRLLLGRAVCRDGRCG